jgi:DNA/RNA-binding domain of Phe-tRNA-synthetase-like protein
LTPSPPVAQHQPVLLSDDPVVQAELRAAGDRLLRRMEEAKAHHEESVRAWDKAMAEMGVDVSVPPIGAEALQQMLIAEGINPADNEFSRGIIEMREE